MEKGRMYLLEQEMQKLKEGYHGSKESVTVFHINHFMDNTLIFNEALKELFGELVFWGVPYHTGISIDCGGFAPDYACYYGKWKQDDFFLYQGQRKIGIYKGDFQAVCSQILEIILQRELLPAIGRGQRILVLEDGGYVCQHLHQWIQRYPALKGKIAGSVEQTTSGTRLDRYYYGTYGYEFPCVSVARSDLKMDVEALFIVNRILRELDQMLYEQNTFLEFHQVLLLGYGVLGRAAAKLLKNRKVRLLVYDTDPRIRKLAQEENCCVVECADKLYFSADTIILGMTGEEAFTLEMLKAFGKSPAGRLYLASGSSKQTEFRAFLRYAEQNKIESRQGKFSYPMFFGEKKETKQIYLLADGMPLNFCSETGGSLTVSMIDLIFTEMLLCGLWICESNGEKRMYLAGAEAIPGLDEKQLFQRWCTLYGLWDKYPEPHPEKDYLRRRTYEKRKF